MTQPVTPWIPGQAPLPGMNYGRLSLPGVTPPTPYGMTPGQRHVLPEQIDLDAPPKPEAINLDNPIEAPKGEPTGYRVTNANGDVVADLPVVNDQDYQTQQVKKVGDALLAQAVTPEDKESASRANAYMLSLVGILKPEEITKRGVALYDADQRNGIAMAVQAAKAKRAAAMGKGGPVGPSKQEKFDKALDDSLRKNVNDIITSERSGSKYQALSEQENEVAQGLQLLSTPNAMAQRIAVQRELLALTGKASRESEQAAITGAAGKWEELKNKLSLWTSDDPQLSQRYVNEMKQMLLSQQRFITEQKSKIGESAAQRAYAEAFGYPDDQRQLAYDTVSGAMTGRYGGSAAYMPRAQTPTGAGAVSSHLQKYLK